MTGIERDPARLFAPPALEVERRTDGSLLLRSPIELGHYPRCIGEHLEHWGRAEPDRAFLLERAGDGQWRRVTYGEALAMVRRIAAGLLRRRLSVERPVAILCDNCINAAMLSLAAMHVGVPVAFISPAYSLLSRDYAKLAGIVTLLRPGLLVVADRAKFGPALDAIHDLHSAEVIAARDLETLLGSDADENAVERAFAAVAPGTVAKLLFTSGSTGEPKGVINTQRMLCANQQAKAQIWPFLAHSPPVLVDWLPWSHTFGGNHNFNLVLSSGGTLYIDDGRPMPGLIDRTVANLREIAPTVYFNVPRGYDMLVAALQADDTLRRNFFSRLQVIFYAAAALPQHLWETLERLARDTVGEPVTLVSAWGSTETAPLATSCHYRADRSGVIGLPIPGCELKLVANAEKLEVRVRGPQVTPGYWRRPDLTASQFDEEGFYCIGDAVRFVDSANPVRGLEFDGRVSEDFKLDSGTRVNVGKLRVQAIAALAPLAQDIVVAGHDRREIGFLVFPNVAACRACCSDLPADAPVASIVAHESVRQRIAAGLAILAAQGQGSSTFATRAVLLIEPPSIDAGEITDKGYINQRAVLARRASWVERLFADEPGDGSTIRLQQETVAGFGPHMP
jgi:feruloyl-CoA synthase